MKVRNKENHKGKLKIKSNYTKEWRETAHACLEDNDANTDAEMERCQTSPIVSLLTYFCVQMNEPLQLTKGRLSGKDPLYVI